ncbi:MAG: VWA domain-containing protein [Acidobacteria bacterium]|nr:VWA domain-containing protein [Acidobacteriota bacterium]
MKRAVSSFRFAVSCGLLILWVSLTTFALAQTPKREQDKTQKPATKESKENPGDTIAIYTSEVLLPVTVRDSRGQFAASLKAEDFEVFEDGIPQPISSFALKRMPVHVVLLIDTSSSVTRELEDFKAAALNFINQLDPEDKICLIRFDDIVELVQDWTSNRNTLKRALNRLGTGMFTKFNDALYLAAKEQLSRVAGRKAVIVLTDGIDSGRGSTTSERAFRTLVEEETSVYVVSKTRIQGRADREKLDFYLRNSSSGASNQLRIDGLKLALAELESSERFLLRIAEETGGRIFLPESFDDLSDAYQQVADELRSQYLIFYTPTNPTRDGSYRSVRVKVKTQGYRATTRFGYYPK